MKQLQPEHFMVVDPFLQQKMTRLDFLRQSSVQCTQYTGHCLKDSPCPCLLHHRVLAGGYSQVTASYPGQTHKPTLLGTLALPLASLLSNSSQTGSRERQLGCHHYSNLLIQALRHHQREKWQIHGSRGKIVFPQVCFKGTKFQESGSITRSDSTMPNFWICAMLKIYNFVLLS